MAELTPLYMDINSVYSGDELGLPWRDIVGEGVIGSALGTVLKVTEKAGGANLSVDIAAGAAWIKGDTNVDAQPIYRVRNDAVVNKGISPDPSNPRKVIIVAQITDETFAGTGRKWELLAIHGTPAGSPTEPALPASALKLAVIDVAAAATSIVNANITDSRVLAAIGGGNIASAGSGPTWTKASTPPGSPADGDIWVLEFVTGMEWHFRYNAGSASSFKWEFIGGTVGESTVATDESTNSTAYVDLTTAGPSFTVPRAGDYAVEIEADIWAASSFGLAFVAAKRGTAASADADAAKAGWTATASPGATVHRRMPIFTGLAAGDVLKAQYRVTSAVTTHFLNRAIRVVPIRVS